ncbi:ribosome silencing factor [Lentibacter sp.]|jgi:ribosome-associated protein|uniref:ribosome silencing factor n=1 Tax=Lentibacter sp. TaxID=2024994 RepID=UPI003F6D3B9C
MLGIGAFRCVRRRDFVLSPNVVAAKGAADAAQAKAKVLSSSELLAIILKSLDDNKAEDVVQIDLRGKTSIGDYMVVCSGRSSRQVGALSEKLAEHLKVDYGRASKIEGKNTGDWVLVDTGDIIVHVFRPEVREFYQLEKMWLTPEADKA